MESKHHRRHQRRRRCELLIEPVWNRNGRALNPVKSLVILLIEPVWNRNEYQRRQDVEIQTF